MYADEFPVAGTRLPARVKAMVAEIASEQNTSMSKVLKEAVLQYISQVRKFQTD